MHSRSQSSSDDSERDVGRPEPVLQTSSRTHAANRPLPSTPSSMSSQAMMKQMRPAHSQHNAETPESAVLSSGHSVRTRAANLPLPLSQSSSLSGMESYPVRPPGLSSVPRRGSDGMTSPPPTALPFRRGSSDSTAEGVRKASLDSAGVRRASVESYHTAGRRGSTASESQGATRPLATSLSFQQRAAAVFDAIDRQCSTDGQVSFEELLKVLKQPLAAKVLFRELDVNSDGMVSINEWQQWFSRLQRKQEDPLAKLEWISNCLSGDTSSTATSALQLRINRAFTHLLQKAGRGEEDKINLADSSAVPGQRPVIIGVLLSEIEGDENGLVDSKLWEKWWLSLDGDEAVAKLEWIERWLGLPPLNPAPALTSPLEAPISTQQGQSEHTVTTQPGSHATEPRDEGASSDQSPHMARHLSVGSAYTDPMASPQLDHLPAVVKDLLRKAEGEVIELPELNSLLRGKVSPLSTAEYEDLAKAIGKVEGDIKVADFKKWYARERALGHDADLLALIVALRATSSDDEGTTEASSYSDSERTLSNKHSSSLAAVSNRLTQLQQQMERQQLEMKQLAIAQQQPSPIGRGVTLAHRRQISPHQPHLGQPQGRAWDRLERASSLISQGQVPQPSPRHADLAVFPRSSSSPTHLQSQNSSLVSPKLKEFTPSPFRARRLSSGGIPTFHPAALPASFDAIRPLLAPRGGAIILFAASATRRASDSRIVPRLLVMGEAAVYIWTVDGYIQRCIPLQAISEVIVGRDGWVGIRVPAEFDVLLKLDGGDADTKPFGDAVGMKQCTVRRTDLGYDELLSILSTTRPTGWTLRREAIIPFSYSTPESDFSPSYALPPTSPTTQPPPAATPTTSPVAPCELGRVLWEPTIPSSLPHQRSPTMPYYPSE